MPSRNQLGLHEEVLLLSLNDDKGTHFTEHANYAVAGAILMEMFLKERIQLGGRKNRLIELVHSTSLGSPLLDEFLGEIRDAKKQSRLQTWLTRIAGSRDLVQRVAKGLCNRGILREDEKTSLWIFRRNVYPQVDPAPKRELIERMRQAIFSDSEEIDQGTAVMVTLAKGAELLPVIFDRKSLKSRKKRIEQIAQGNAVGHATKEAIAALGAATAVSAAVIAAGAVTVSGM